MVLLFTEMDIVPYALTLLIGLFVSPEMGMIVGTLSHLCILLYSSGNPKVYITKEKVCTVYFIYKNKPENLFQTKYFFLKEFMESLR